MGGGAVRRARRSTTGRSAAVTGPSTSTSPPRLDHWCGQCDKCCFIDLILAPFMSRGSSCARCSRRRRRRRASRWPTRSSGPKFRRAARRGDQAVRVRRRGQRVPRRRGARRPARRPRRLRRCSRNSPPRSPGARTRRPRRRSPRCAARSAPASSPRRIRLRGRMTAGRTEAGAGRPARGRGSASGGSAGGRGDRAQAAHARRRAGPRRRQPERRAAYSATADGGLDALQGLRGGHQDPGHQPATAPRPTSCARPG